MATKVATRAATRAKTRPDWRLIRAAFEGGSVSDRALARQHGLSHTAIQKRAKAESWKRPTLGAEPVMQAPALPTVAEASVSQALSDAAAAEPKELIRRGRDLVGRLLDELDSSTTHVGQLEELIMAETEGDRDGRRRAAMLRAVALPTRAAVLKNLAAATRIMSEAAPGKKDEAAEAARTAGAGTEWGDDLAGPDVRLN